MNYCSYFFLSFCGLILYIVVIIPADPQMPQVRSAHLVVIQAMAVLLQKLPHLPTAGHT
jgi:hypothetical protein